MFLKIDQKSNPKSKSKGAAARYSERGSALVYILIAIALLAALTFTFMEPSSQQTSSQNTFRTVTAVQSQMDMIRSAIQECVLSYPNGDPNIDTSGSGSDPGARVNYPISPDSTYYTAATPGQSGNELVSAIRCTGDNPGGANVANHARIFSGASGKFLPPPPDLFGAWQYHNGTDGVFFWLATDKSDAFLISALEKLDDKYSECETDIIDATGANVAMDSYGTTVTQCPSGSVCFRAWMIMNGSANHQDAGCP
jgi:type II secretory pathway pseudopilin PulG